MTYQRKPYRKTYKKKTYKKKTTPVASFNKRVLSVIHREAENKNAVPLIYRGNPIRNRLDNAATQCIPLMPNIGQGDGQGDRVGNQVTTIKAMLYLQTHIFQNTSPGNDDPPKWIDVYIYKFKPTNAQTAISLSQFLQYGNTSIFYDSVAIPECTGLPLNKDKFALKKHIRRTLWNPNPANVYALATRNVPNAFDMKIDITKYLKKKIMYNDDVTNVVTNDNLFISVVFTTNDNHAYSTTQSFGSFNAMLNYEYEDL